MRRPGLLSRALVAGYVLVVAAVIFGLFRARRIALEIYGTPAAQAAWDEWVGDVKMRRAGDVPREVPRSDRPPALVLMQEHFVTCLVGALLVTSALYGSIAWLLYGAVTSPGPDAPHADGGGPPYE